MKTNIKRHSKFTLSAVVFAIACGFGMVTGCVGERAQDLPGAMAKEQGISQVIQEAGQAGETKLTLLDSEGGLRGTLVHLRSNDSTTIHFSWEGNDYMMSIEGERGPEARSSIVVNGVPITGDLGSGGETGLPIELKPVLDLAASLVFDAGLEQQPPDAEILDAAPGLEPAAYNCTYCDYSYWCAFTRWNGDARVYGHWDPYPACDEAAWDCGC